MSQRDHERTPIARAPDAVQGPELNAGGEEETRRRILETQLIERLTDHALGRMELTTTQLRAIEMLLRRVAPDSRPARGEEGVALRHEDALAELD